MKIRNIIAVFAIGITAAVSGFAYTFSVSDLSKISTGLDDFTDELTVAVPQAATQQNVWADAYIGKLFPSIPVHIGGGFNVGLTHLDTSGLAEAADALYIDNVSDSYYLPVFAADLRIGGIILPFDFDIAVMKTGTISTGFSGTNLDFDFFTIGADFRYAVIEGNVILPKVSLGVGYFYNQGSLSASSSDAEATVDYKTHTMYAQAQVSKKFLFITPFVGFRGLVSSSDNSWEWKTSGDLATVAALAGKSSDSGTVETNGFDWSGIQPQLFAGCGFNLFVLQTTFSVTADLRNIGNYGLWSGAFSLRLKL
jgi:hypothetical protein